MNGRFLLDTNAVIALLNGDPSIATILQSASWIGISVMTEIEFLAFSGLTSQDEALFRQFKTRVEVIDLRSSDTDLLHKIISIRKTEKLKMPDAIIAATAVYHQATILTQDAGLLKVNNVLSQGF